MAPCSSILAATFMPLMNARQALPTSKLSQVSASLRLACTMQAVDGSIESRETEVLMRMPMREGSMSARSSTFLAARVAASEGSMPWSQKRRSSIPATSISGLPRKRSFSKVGASRSQVSTLVTRLGASTTATDLMTTLSNNMNLHPGHESWAVDGRRTIATLYRETGRQGTGGTPGAGVCQTAAAQTPDGRANRERWWAVKDSNLQPIG